MLILSIDTSTFAGSAALTRGAELLAEECLNVRRTHAARLLPAIERMFADCGLSYADLDALALTVGPGSFTGLRISLATVKGLAYGTGKPVVGVSTLAALAQNLAFCRYPVCPVLDAKKKQVYCGLYRDGGEGVLRPEWEDRAVRPEDIQARIKEPTVFLGDGLKEYGGLLREKLGPLALFAPENYAVVRPSNVARLARERLLRGDADDPALLVPRYLRRSDAELAREANRLTNRDVTL